MPDSSHISNKDVGLIFRLWGLNLDPIVSLDFPAITINTVGPFQKFKPLMVIVSRFSFIKKTFTPTLYGRIRCGISLVVWMSLRGPWMDLKSWPQRILTHQLHGQDTDHKATRPRSYTVTWKSGLYSRAGCFADLGFSMGF